MEHTTPWSADVSQPLPASTGPERQLSALESLLETLDETRAGTRRSHEELRYQRRLVQARLGLASSLYLALQARHASTALHCLRVALGCSAWSLRLGLAEDELDGLEVAALLHDVGKISVPDQVLLKPARLSGEELLVMERQRRAGFEILQSCCTDQRILDVVHYLGAWYDGRQGGFDRSGDDLPLGSRMIDIVDAFDAMTTDHVYRPAMSRERAMAELFEHGGSQFDPRLVESFHELLGADPLPLHGEVGRRWLRDMQPQRSNLMWGLGTVPPGTPAPEELQFHERLLESMGDAVIFVDAERHIRRWNRAAERLTGLDDSTVYQKQFLPSLVGLRDEDNRPIKEQDCPLLQTLVSGVQTWRRLVLHGRSRQPISVDVQLIPVLAADGRPRGAAVLLHDASSQVTLEQRVQSLHEKATRDPLTQVANRAEFDGALVSYVENHQRDGMPCSLLICDLDHFKRVNDTYGHQAGDQVLTAFAGVLRQSCRSGDLVARYGGEEFVVLYADCDNASATRRAEQIRQEWAAISHPALGGENSTASFGVTELQPGDTDETMLRRADRALLQAKDAGRNFVVQLGGGMGGQEVQRPGGWLSWLLPPPADQLIERTLLTAVPLKVAAEKLRGFASDHEAEIVTVEGNSVVLRIASQPLDMLRRASDRPVPLLIELKFEEQAAPAGESGPRRAGQRTLIRVVIRPKRQRDRRRREVMDRARQLLISLKAYFVAHEHTLATPPATASQSGVVQRLMLYWLR